VEDLTRATDVGPLWELPPTVCPVGPWRVPVGGGTYLRLIPFPLLAWCLRHVAAKGQPLVLYLHPWETHPGTPRVSLSWPSRWATYGGQRRALRKIGCLLAEYRFVPLAELLGLRRAGQR
jgi:hypothetical protein